MSFKSGNKVVTPIGMGVVDSFNKEQDKVFVLVGDNEMEFHPSELVIDYKAPTSKLLRWSITTLLSKFDFTKGEYYEIYNKVVEIISRRK